MKYFCIKGTVILWIAFIANADCARTDASQLDRGFQNEGLLSLLLSPGPVISFFLSCFNFPLWDFDCLILKEPKHKGILKEKVILMKSEALLWIGLETIYSVFMKIGYLHFVREMRLCVRSTLKAILALSCGGMHEAHWDHSLDITDCL